MSTELVFQQELHAILVRQCPDWWPSELGSDRFAQTMLTKNGPAYDDAVLAAGDANAGLAAVECDIRRHMATCGVSKHERDTLRSILEIYAADIQREMQRKFQVR